MRELHFPSLHGMALRGMSRAGARRGDGLVLWDDGVVSGVEEPPKLCAARWCCASSPLTEVVVDARAWCRPSLLASPFVMLGSGCCPFG